MVGEGGRREEGRERKGRGLGGVLLPSIPFYSQYSQSPVMEGEKPVLRNSSNLHQTN